METESKREHHSIDFVKFMSFNNWADRVYLDYIEDLSTSQFTEVIPTINKSLKGILFHIYHSYWGEFHLITDEDWSDEQTYEEMDKDAIISGIKSLNVQILTYLEENSINKPFSYNDPRFTNPINTNVEYVMLNFIEHSSYHRGQLALLLKYHGIENLTDVNYNPYIWKNKQ